MGIAYLHGYRFQINQRGFANVVPSPNDVVAGLCYLISAEDEARLDINEGVAIGSYEKEILDVEISLPNAAVAGRRVSEIIGYGLLRGSVDGERQVTSVRGEPLQALVYVSRRYTTEGDPRDEYVDRMNLGVTDALKLGVSEEYVKKYIRTYIPLR